MPDRPDEGLPNVESFERLEVTGVGCSELLIGQSSTPGIVNVGIMPPAAGLPTYVYRTDAAGCRQLAALLLNAADLADSE